MKLGSLIVLSSAILHRRHVTALPNTLATYSPQEWQQKWDTWPTNDVSSLRRRLADREVLGNATTLEPDINPAEVCERITGCVGRAAATAAGYTAVAAVATAQFCSDRANAATNALMANNYQLARQIAAYTATEIALPFVINFGTYYINVRLQNAAPQSKDDSCGVSQTQAIAEQGGTATYGFCLQLKQITSDKAFSRVEVGTVSTDNQNDDVGLDLSMRLFISTVKGKFDSACSLLGIQLKK